ncbi:MAG: DUF4437 domain-containing protein [Methylacidiphilales bacterium]|nr:DUF4437 domain-containing protein [Candidatus Methylacidiphilales bacterium]
MTRPHIEPFCDRDIPFRNMTLAGFGRGLKYKTLSLDPETGACSLTVMMPGGYRQPPGLSYSELEIMVVEGSMVVGGRTVGRGHYFFVPAGYAMPAISTQSGCLLLYMYNTGIPSFEASSEHHALCAVSRYHDVDSYNDIPWAAGNIAKPSVASGCMIKLLNYNPESLAMTFLYCMTPHFWQDNISYHDCAEESYHLWGTSWMMQFGDVPTGGYFWRPAYINHGAFASELGCIALGRVDSKLFNHFHYNPWSTPKENRERSAARVMKRDPLLYKWIVSYGHNHPHGPSDFEDTMVRQGHLHFHGQLPHKH